DLIVTGVQTCALPISERQRRRPPRTPRRRERQTHDPSLMFSSRKTADPAETAESAEIVRSAEILYVQRAFAGDDGFATHTNARRSEEGRVGKEYRSRG